MKRSFLRLVIASVLGCYAVGVLVIAVVALRTSWAEKRVESEGVRLAVRVLEETPQELRQQRLAEMKHEIVLPLELLEPDEVAARAQGPLTPGESRTVRVAAREEWVVIAFHDGSGALAVGPVPPGPPPGYLPVGLVLSIVGIPAIAGLIALRVERQLGKVERASQAIAQGQLSVRVDNERGPSNELAASFNVMAERIEQLIRSRDELVQAVSHELGSPLSRLRFHVDLLQGEDDDARARRLETMGRDLDALDELVAELLQYVQTDELVLEPDSFDPGKGLRDLVELAELELPAGRSLALKVDLPAGTRVYADPRQFQRAVENILRNATRYAAEQVRLELRVQPDGVWVGVHDDGPGIPEAMREEVKAPFFRLERDRSRDTGGTGLGLAIVNRIVLRHGGELKIATSSLGGAEVSTFWPAG